MEISDAVLKEYCRNARAYGWEVGHGSPMLSILKATRKNPFLKPNWESKVIYLKGGNMKNSFAFIAGGLVALAGVVVGIGTKNAAKPQTTK